MSESTIVTLRLPKTLVERADALIPRVREDDEMVIVGRVSRSIVLRLAVLRGLESLEREFSERETRKGKKRR